ncbi:GspH/FimT family pseudopilin [Aliiglaciecola sp. LCG003]|uniref:GspH/FimT family pseudopilin n=1 Tax=Aliiglaciecola sp. LCG003 TaxID=3053655 RepID=UPI002573BA45|nr:GspH/FimT family pseudopilin [Aliiglaciecola sp. LCG003]WJG08493.1 prepilin-type N-terminal cleavage/methylation domain-containing protein [Aliiglaciecola sp. LCG003]
MHLIIKTQGFSLLEAMIVVSIITLIAALGGPSITAALHHQQLKGALQQSYYLLQQGRAFAVTQAKEVTVQFSPGQNWCVALSDRGTCDCKQANACTLGNQSYQLTAKDYPFIHLPKVTMGNDNAVIFDKTRGSAMGNAGSSVFTNGTTQAKLVISNLGRVRICVQQGQIGAYSAC